ncbi:MAG TPA: hypothetical protein VGC42_16315 [Kofleriaceae bacterium]
MISAISAASLMASCSHGGPGPGSPGEPPSTKDQDTLWQLAPQGAKLGLVLSSRGVTLLEHGALALRGLLAVAPDLAELKQQLDAALAAGTGSSQPMLADFGLSHDRGLAVFMAADESPIIVLPVTDRGKFVAKVHGTTAGDTDTIHGHPCKQLGAHYVCVKDPATYATLGKSGLDVARKAITSRGDFELVTSGVAGPTGTDGAGVIQLTEGAFIVRGTVFRVPAEVTSALGAPIDVHGDATAAGFGAIDISPYLSKVPAFPIGNNVSTADLAKSFTGSVLLTAAAGTHRFEIHIPLRDPAPARALIEHCNEIAPMAMLGATLSGKACRVPVPKSGITVEATVANNEINLTAIGLGGADAGAVQHLPATAIGSLLAASQWTMALYGRGSLLSAALPKEALASLPAEAPLAFRAMSLLSESGMALRKDGTTVSFVLGVRTIWANPDEVVQKLIAISPDQIISGAARDTGRKIAEATPTAPFAYDYRAGIGGGVVLAMPAGVLAAIAIPAFMDYTKASKKAATDLQDKNQIAAPPAN